MHSEWGFLRIMILIGNTITKGNEVRRGDQLGELISKGLAHFVRVPCVSKQRVSKDVITSFFLHLELSGITKKQKVKDRRAARRYLLTSLCFTQKLSYYVLVGCLERRILSAVAGIRQDSKKTNVGSNMKDTTPASQASLAKEQNYLAESRPTA
jgi:hypothetical protein